MPLISPNAARPPRLPVLLLAACALLATRPAAPAGLDRIAWDGGGADTSWFTPQNWDGDRVPDGGAAAVFDATSGKDCMCMGAAQVGALEIGAGYTGTLRFDEATLVLLSPDIAIEQAGGTLDFGTNDASLLRTHVSLRGSVHLLGGEFVPTDAEMQFESAAVNRLELRAESAGVAIGSLITHNATVEVFGAVTVSRHVEVGRLLIFPLPSIGGHLIVRGTVVLGPACELLVSGTPSGAPECVLETAPGALLDAVEASSFSNLGILEDGSGLLRRPAHSLAFTDALGGTLPSATFDDHLHLTLLDEDANVSGAVFDTEVVIVRTPFTGDAEEVIVGERSFATAMFRNDIPLVVGAGTAVPGDGILQFNGSEDIIATYTDANDPEDVVVVRIVQSLAGGVVVR